MDKDYKLNFEFESRNGNFNLYERGGDRHIELNRNFNEPVRVCSGGDSDELDALYLVVQIGAGDNSEYDFRGALGEFVETYKIAFDFDFVACGMGVGLNERQEIKGEVRVKGGALDWEVDKIFFDGIEV